MQNAQLKIAQIIDQLSVGGTENVLVTLANVLSSHGHKVTVVTTITPGPLAANLDENITRINLARKSKWNIADMYRLYKIIKQYDVIHVHSSYNLRYVFLVSRLFVLKKTIFFHEHFGDIEIDATVKWHQRLIYPKTVMICVSRKIYDWAKAHLNMGDNSLFMLPNIVLKKQLTENAHRDNNTLQLIIVSNIRPTKNIEFALQVLHRLKQARPCHLTVIGQKSDEGYYQKLQSIIQSLGLSNNITMLHNVQDIQPLLPGYHLAIHTAKSESGPLVLIEYLAQSLPFLTYSTGEVVLQIKDELPGNIINSFDVDAWVARIEQLAAQPFAESARQLSSVYSKYFSSEAYYRQCVDIYQKGVAEK